MTRAGEGNSTNSPREEFLSLSLTSSRKSYFPQLRKQLDIAKENERRLQLLLDNLPALISYIDNDRRYVSVNRTYETATDMDRNQIVGRHIRDVLGPENYQKIEHHLEEALNGKNVRFETSLSTMGGRLSWLEIHYEPDIDPERGVMGCYVLAVDLTEKKLAEAEKEKLEKMLLQVQKIESLGTLAAGIAHDFNNILSPLLGYAEMLKEDLPQDSPLQPYVGGILSAALRSKDLVKQILAFSRQSDKEVMPMKLQPILQEVIKLLRASIPATIDIRQDIDSRCGIVMADPSQIHQILMNLATNAFHAMEEMGGRLTLSLSQIRIDPDPPFFPDLPPGNYASLKVSDTGIGIGKDIIDRIFDPYFTTKPKNKGTGLGLSIVQGILKTFHGDIRVTSEPGKGSEFCVYLPIAEQKIEAGASEVTAPVRGGNERILLVDDEEDVAAMEQQMMERLGYHVTKRIGSMEALETFIAAPDRFDLIVTDMAMPGMTGVHLAKKIKQLRPEIPVIICTGFSERINEEHIAHLGIDGYIMKPVIKRQMAELIRKTIDDALKNHLFP